MDLLRNRSSLEDLWFANHLDSQKSDEKRTKLVHKPRKHADSLGETGQVLPKRNVLGVD
jgi:hypothetical protein